MIWSNPRQEHRLEKDVIESSPVEKHSGFRWMKSMSSSSRDRIVPLCSAHLRLPLLHPALESQHGQELLQ